MTQTFSKSRAKAEIAFSSVQSQFFSRSQGLEEQNAVVQARDERPRACAKPGTRAKQPIWLPSPARRPASIRKRAEGGTDLCRMSPPPIV